MFFGYWYKIFFVESGVIILVSSILFFSLLFIWYNLLLLNKRDVINKKIEQDLHTTEQKFSLLIDNVKEYAIFMVDQDGLITSWNNGAQAIKGYVMEEIIGSHISTFYLEEELKAGIPAYNLKMAKEKGYYRGEGWRKRKDGTRFWADVTFTALYDKTNELQGFVKITRDMSERKRAQEKIAYQSRLIEDTGDAILSSGASLRIASWNKAAETLYGYTAREAIGQHINHIFKNPLDEQALWAILQHIQRHGYWKGEHIHFTKKGEFLTILISVSGIKDDQGNINGYIMVCRDITERIKAEEQLRTFSEKLEEQVKEKTAELTQVFDRVSDGVVAFDKTGRITYINKKAAEMHKVNPRELIGENYRTVIPLAASVFHENFDNAISQQQNMHFQMFSATLKLWLECYMYPSFNGLSLFFRDITEQRNSQELLQQFNAEYRELASHLQNIREEERAAIAREIHDELGQQLTGLKMDLSWIYKKVGSREPASIAPKVKSALELLNNTIHTVRRIATELRPSLLDDLGLVAAIEWHSQEFEKRSGISTFFRCGTPEMDFPPDIAIGLFRICQESLTNVARHAGAKRVEITLDWICDQLTLIISDDGKGLTGKNTGNKKTLGLLGMQERAQMMGGQLHFDKEEDKGLKLVVTVPLPALVLE